ncbi:hypothetical protein FZC76_10240 [Sutcliffiella horikoshii]|uniref:Glycosyltransferase family 2 protein n=1 Tax=Sutcliffiella horikoshii TaxID=79883 RepID=A0A5D4SYT6_9BACI|nr:hypothetical protein [Sutcliffiella horikoshii]TYS68119.1 hypothetical protein FZC76_10240 [Sutcliffiella horikoshii]
MPNIALLTVTHDPLGKNIKLFKELQKELEDTYSDLYITISDESSIRLLEQVQKSNFKVKIIPKKGAAAARREVVKFGLTGHSDYYHYCDLDRLLTWGVNHLEELKLLISNLPNCDYLILGRSERAMETHPVEWIETENITNKICSLELGMNVDITAGSCLFSRSSAEYINKHSKEKMTDAEWAMIVHRIANLEIGYAPCEGLEYHEEINGITKSLSESEKWMGRLKLSSIISETAITTGK